MIGLPAPVLVLYQAHKAMCKHFEHTGLKFTLDGKLIGDIGEALVAEAFGITLCARRTPGVDGHTADGRSVQIKATGRMNAGPAFTPGRGVAHHLIFVRIDFSAGNVAVLYNGPEARIRALLPKSWSGTKEVRIARLLEVDADVGDDERLPIV